MDHNIIPTHFSMYDMEMKETTLYWVLYSDTGPELVTVLVTIIDEDRSTRAVYSINSKRRTFTKAAFDAIEKSAISGIGYHADLTLAYRKLGVTLPREQGVDLLYSRAHELAKQLDKVGEDSVGIFAYAKAHGVEYTGATYEKELNALREILVEFYHKTLDNNSDDDI